MRPLDVDKWALVMPLVREEAHDLFRGHSVLGVDEDDMTQTQMIRMWLRDAKPNPPPWRPEFVGLRVRQQMRRWLANARRAERGETSWRRRDRWPAVQRDGETGTTRTDMDVHDLREAVGLLPQRLKDIVECWIANAGNVRQAAKDMDMTRWRFESAFTAAVAELRGMLRVPSMSWDRK